MHWINGLTEVSFSKENILEMQPKIFDILPLLVDIFAISLQPNGTENLSKDVWDKIENAMKVHAHARDASASEDIEGE